MFLTNNFLAYSCSDFGFERPTLTGLSPSQQCVRNKSLSNYNPYAVPDVCSPGAFYNRTKGYRKIPGDVCIGGTERKFLPTLLPCPLK